VLRATAHRRGVGPRDDRRAQTAERGSAPWHTRAGPASARRTRSTGARDYTSAPEGTKSLDWAVCSLDRVSPLATSLCCGDSEAWAVAESEACDAASIMAQHAARWAELLKSDDARR
jgi:hypothetical protein